MPGSETRDARRTERYLNGLMAADARRAADVPMDTDLDPEVQLAARELRAGLVRVHPSFRFEESLSARLGAEAARLRAGLPLERAAGTGAGTLALFHGRAAAAAPAALAVAAAPVAAKPVAAESAAPQPAEVAQLGPGGPAGTAAAIHAAGADPAAGEPAPGPAIQPGRAIWPAAAFRRLPDMTARPSRPFIVGGVGVASAAISIGAVYVAWRHSRPTSSGMGRAARAAHGRAGSPGRGRRTGVINGILGVVS